MTTKQSEISVINSFIGDARLDKMIDRLYLFRKFKWGIPQADAGDAAEHEKFMTELEREDVK